MKELTEENILLLKVICAKLGIKGDVDKYGNVFDAESTEETDVERRILGWKFTVKRKQVNRKRIPVMTLGEIIARCMGVSYDPNAIVKSAALKMLGGEYDS